MWSRGSIKVGNVIVKYFVKHFEEGSVYGIDGGKISKLELRIKNETVANYDRGWDIEPTTSEAFIALALLKKKYN